MVPARLRKPARLHAARQWNTKEGGDRRPSNTSGDSGTAACRLLRLRDQVAIIDKRVRDTARQDEICRRLMTTPGVGPIVALTFGRPWTSPNGSALQSRSAHPRTERRGDINREKPTAWGRSRVGSRRPVRSSPCHADAIRRMVEPQGCGREACAASRLERAKVALARKLAVILHRMWVDGTDFRFTAASVVATMAH